MVTRQQKYLWAVALFLLLGVGCWIAFSFSGCSSDALKDAPAGCFEFWFNRYQTLLSAVAAFAAAYVAVRPVWEQLHHSAIQTTVALRDATSARANLITTRAEKSNSRLKEFWAEFLRGHETTKDDGSAQSHWIWDQESIIDRQIAILENEQAENIDGDETTISRQKLLAALYQLENCASDINATVHLGYSLEDGEDDPVKQAKAEEEEVRAKDQLPKCIPQVENAIVNLQAAFGREIEALRLKRLLLDKTIVQSEVGGAPV